MSHSLGVQLLVEFLNREDHELDKPVYVVVRIKGQIQKIKLIPCTACGGTGDCQGITARESCGEGCDCRSSKDCPSLGACVVCKGEAYKVEEEHEASS